MAYHVITAHFLVATTDADGDAAVAREIVQSAIAGACSNIEAVSGRDARVGAVVVEPLQVLTPDEFQRARAQRQEHSPT